MLQFRRNPVTGAIDPMMSRLSAANVPNRAAIQAPDPMMARMTSNIDKAVVTAPPKSYEFGTSSYLGDKISEGVLRQLGVVLLLTAPAWGTLLLLNLPSKT